MKKEDKMKKLIAGFMTALMTLLSVTSPVLAATALGDYPSFLGVDGTLDAYVVVGEAAAPSDVVGALDLIVRLVELSYEEKVVPGVAVTEITGLDRDGIRIGDVSGGDLLTQGGRVYSVAFPSGGVLKSFHYSGLLDSTFSWRTTEYDFHEQVDVSSVKMRHDFGTSRVNGTEKMEIRSGWVIYEYVFDEALTGTGSIATPNYTYPIYIDLLGTEFAIVGTGSNQAKVLQGSIGTATATSAVVYGDHSIYSDLGSDGSWARVIIKDAEGNTVDTLVINQGDSKSTTATDPDLTVQVTAVRALQDGTIVGADVVVGPSDVGVVKTYDTTADTTSTGAASDKFPGETVWGIRVASGDFGTAGQITATDKLQVVYQPTTIQYLIAGEKLTLPNDYTELGFEGWGTDKFATITIEPITSVSAYNSTGNVVGSNLNGIKISSDVAGSVVGLAANGYDYGYVLFAPRTTATNPTASYPVYIGFWDAANTRIKVADSATNVTGSEVIKGTANETVWFYMNSSADFRYDFKLSYAGAGERDYWLNVTVDIDNRELISNMTAGYADVRSGEFITMGFQNKSSPVWSTSDVPEFRLGGTEASAETTEVNSTSEASVNNIGKASQDVVDDSGIIVLSPATYGASDKVVLSVPSKELTVHAYFGKKGAEAAEEEKYNVIKAITTAVAKLDTEVDAAVKAKNIVSVGGPAINSISAEAMGLEYPTYGASGLLPFAEGEGYIAVYDDTYTTGKVVVVAAGWEAAETRLACSVLQNYETTLAGETASAVKVSGASWETATITAA